MIFHNKQLEIHSPPNTYLKGLAPSDIVFGVEQSLVRCKNSFIIVF